MWAGGEVAGQRSSICRGGEAPKEVCVPGDEWVLRVRLGSVDILETVFRSLGCILQTMGRVGGGGVKVVLSHQTLGRGQAGGHWLGTFKGNLSLILS